MLPIFVTVPKSMAGLLKDSVVDAGQLATVGKEILRSRVGTLPPRIMEEVDRALETSMGLKRD